MQVSLCRAKNTGEVYAMKKLKKSEMLSRGQVNILSDMLLDPTACYFCISLAFSSSLYSLSRTHNLVSVTNLMICSSNS